MRLCEIVGLVGYVLDGLPGEQLLKRLGIKSRDDTVLRRIKARRTGAIQPAVRVLSVDDWALAQEATLRDHADGLGAVTGDRPASRTIRR